MFASSAMRSAVGRSLNRSVFVRSSSISCYTRQFSQSRVVFGESEADLKRKLDTLKEDLQDWKDKVQRVTMDKTTIQNNSLNEITDAKNYGITSFAKQLLNVNDSLRLALENTELDSEDPKQQLEILKEGLLMTHTEAVDILEKIGVIDFVPNVGDVYHKDEHEIVNHIFETIEHGKPSSVVNSIVAPGKKLNHKVVKLAKVGVTTTKLAEKSVEESDSSSSDSSSESSDEENNKEQKKE